MGRRACGIVCLEISLEASETRTGFGARFLANTQGMIEWLRTLLDLWWAYGMHENNDARLAVEAAGRQSQLYLLRQTFSGQLGMQEVSHAALLVSTSLSV